MALPLWGGRALAQPASPAELSSALYPRKEELKLADFVQRVLDRNSAIQARVAAFHSSRSLYRAEGGTFEPALVGSSEYVDRQRPNTIEIERSLRSGGVFIERNRIHVAGVEVRTPIGGRVRVGGSMRQLRNNIQREVIVDLDAEYEESVDILVEQPLLKNFGLGVTFAPKRLAARNAEVAFQDYRREVMQIVAQAEVAYWELALAQEQYRLSTESVKNAESLLRDARARFEAGRGTELDVLETQAGLASRVSRQSTARQRLVESVNRLAAFFGGEPEVDGVQYFAVEKPSVRPVAAPYQEGAASAFSLSPDLLRGRGEIEQEKLRVKVARNQRLPLVNLRATFASAGLGFDWDSAYNDVRKAEFPQWTVGVELRIPIGVGIRERNELLAARQRLMQAELMVQNLEGQVRTELDAAIRRVGASATTARSNQTAVAFRERLWRDRLSAAQAGRLDTRIVLEAEEELVVARLQSLDSEVEYERALLELQMLQGRLLANRGVDLPMDQFEADTREWARRPGTAFGFLRYTPADLPAPEASAAP